MPTTPYSHAVGVHNTRVQVAEDATLEDLVDLHSTPIQLDVASIEYHNADKRARGNVKKALPYFVGGVLDGKRHDTHVKSRTLLTLDIEQGPDDDFPPPAPSVVTARLATLGGAGWVYTSLSHTPNSPRYRVVLPLAKPIEGEAVEAMQAALEASTRNAAKKLGIEAWCQPESWVLSQPMYLPAKLKGGKFFSEHVTGKPWRTVLSGGIATDAGGAGSEGRVRSGVADIPDEKPDLVLHALKKAGLYLNEDPNHKGKHYITCPFVDQHEAENDTQTVYYEAHHDGNPRAAVKCFDTAPDEDGKPHLTYRTLVHWLVDNGHMDRREQADTGVLDDFDVFVERAGLGRLLDTTPVAREWAVEQFAPVGKVTVLAGPGGVAKSVLMLNLLVHGAMGQTWGAFKVGAPLRSLYISYEDDTQELHSRTHALAKALREADDGVLDTLYDVTGTIRKNLLMFAADDEAAAWLLLTKPDRFEPPERTERVEWLVGLIKHARIKVLVLDPAVYTHQLEENNIADMATYMQTLTYIAKQANCAVIVLHHMNKMGGYMQLDEVTQGSLRGASSFADNARSVAVMVSMSIKDAPMYGLPPEHTTVSKYAVLKHVKHNYSAPLPTQVFERKGALLLPRPDIVKLDAAMATEIKQRQADEAQMAVVIQNALKALDYLDGMDGFVSQTQISVNGHVHKRRIKEVVQYLADQDYVEVEEGTKGGQAVRITRVGRSWLKLQRKEAEK